MRDGLAPLNGKKSLFYATFQRFGWRKFRGQYVGKTLLFLHVRDKDGREVADHLWFKMGKGFDKLGLRMGDEVAFHARVDTYAKGGRDSDEYDFHLEYPEHLVKVSDNEQAKIA